MRPHHNLDIKISCTGMMLVSICAFFIIISSVSADPHYPPNEYTIPLQGQWNLISLPLNVSILTNEITIRNNSINYTFSEAIGHHIILGFLYEWDRGNQTYLLADGSILEPGNGYWLWAYYPCALIIHSDVRGDGYITRLKPQWNILGQTYNASLPQENLLILYNGTLYPWANATSTYNEEDHPLILNFIYNWNSPGQFYDLTSRLTPGEGNWMYAYYNCSIQQVIDAPVILDNSADTTGTGNNFICNASISDPDGVDSAWLEYWYGTGSHSFAPMLSTGINSYYEKILAIPSNSLNSLHYIIIANDTKNYWNSTPEHSIIIDDDDAPVIINVLTSPPSTFIGGFINISCDVTDNIAVNQVKLYLTYPDLTTVNIPMINDVYYYLNQTYFMNGTYKFFIWANDTDNNHNTTVNHTFIITSNTYTITASAGTGGFIFPNGNISVNSGENKTFGIASDFGYHILNVLVDNVSQGPISSYTFYTVNADHTIHASFAADQYTITASAGIGGFIFPNGNIPVNSGENKTFGVASDFGYYIQDVFVDNVSQGPISSYTFYNVTSDHTIHAIFALDQYTIIATAGTGGIISPSGTIVVNSGVDQTFSFAAEPDYHIQDVFVDNVSQGPISSYTFYSVTSDHTIHAIFALDQYTIIATAGTGGIISPNGNVTVNAGSNQTFGIAANFGYHVQDVLVDNVSQGAISSYTFYAVSADHTIIAAFEID